MPQIELSNKFSILCYVGPSSDTSFMEWEIFWKSYMKETEGATIRPVSENHSLMDENTYSTVGWFYK